MRLSQVVGDYVQAGGITDRQQHVAEGGETTFTLTFVDGSEECFLNGGRLFKGAANDYVTATNRITLTEPLRAGDELILVGRATTNEIPFANSASETVTLTSGQTLVIFSTIETSPLELYVSGTLVDRGRLVPYQDYTITSPTSVTLTHTFPAGTVVEGVQGARLAAVDPDNMIVNDGETSKSLSARFAETQASRPFFIQSNGLQLQEVAIGTVLKRWMIGNDGVPFSDVSGEYPVLQLDKSYWDPQITGSAEYTVSNYRITGNTMTLDAVDEYNNYLNLTYTRRIAKSYAEGDTVDYGLITSDVYDRNDDGGL